MSWENEWIRSLVTKMPRRKPRFSRDQSETDYDYCPECGDEQPVVRQYGNSGPYVIDLHEDEEQERCEGSNCPMPGHGGRRKMQKTGEWVPHQGTRGGVGAKNIRTGEVVYGPAAQGLLSGQGGSRGAVTSMGDMEEPGENITGPAPQQNPPQNWGRRDPIDYAAGDTGREYHAGRSVEDYLAEQTGGAPDWMQGDSEDVEVSGEDPGSGPMMPEESIDDEPSSFLCPGCNQEFPASVMTEEGYCRNCEAQTEPTGEPDYDAEGDDIAMREHDARQKKGPKRGFMQAERDSEERGMIDEGEDDYDPEAHNRNVAEYRASHGMPPLYGDTETTHYDSKVGGHVPTKGSKRVGGEGGKNLTPGEKKDYGEQGENAPTYSSPTIEPNNAEYGRKRKSFIEVQIPSYRMLETMLKSIPPKDAEEVKLPIGTPNNPKGPTIRVAHSDKGPMKKPKEDEVYYEYPEGSDRGKDSANEESSRGEQPRGFFQRSFDERLSALEKDKLKEPGPEGPTAKREDERKKTPAERMGEGAQDIGHTVIGAGSPTTVSGAGAQAAAHQALSSLHKQGPLGLIAGGASGIGQAIKKPIEIAGNVAGQMASTAQANSSQQTEQKGPKRHAPDCQCDECREQVIEDEDLLAKPGHNHKKKFERLLGHIKQNYKDNPSKFSWAENADEAAHRIAYSKLGKNFWKDFNGHCPGCFEVQKAIENPVMYFEVMQKALTTGVIHEGALSPRDFYLFRQEHAYHLKEGGN